MLSHFFTCIIALSFRQLPWPLRKEGTLVGLGGGGGGQEATVLIPNSEVWRLKLHFGCCSFHHHHHHHHDYDYDSLSRCCNRARTQDRLTTTE